MDLPELPRRIYTFGKEPTAMKSISYHTDNSKLFAALSEGLRADEYEELKESKLGVFIKFKELNFNWASRLVHYILDQTGRLHRCWLTRVAKDADVLKRPS
ncbi:hypothetical protein Bca4012_083588 [Brassica carinata]